MRDRYLTEPTRKTSLFGEYDVVVLGGAKVSDKLGVIKALLPKVDVMLVGGAMCFTLLVAEGFGVGRSLVEEDMIDSAASVLGSSGGSRLILPTDLVAAEGTPLVAVESGSVWSIGYHWAGGNGLYIKGDSGDIYYYAHMQGYASGMSAGTRLGVGQVVGYVGHTGAASVSHLHIGFQPGGGPLVNPYQLMVKLCR